MTYSVWAKIGTLGTQRLFYEGYTSVSDYEGLVFNTSNQLEWQAQVNGGTSYGVRTPAVFRDPSAWYHIVCAIDTTQATDTNRVRIYVNGVEQTGLTTFYSGFPAQNTDLEWNNQSSTQVIGWGGHFGYYDGYMTEINMIDGQQLTPSSFGQTSSTTGVWIPKKFSGTYGTNGFYLDFEDTSSTTALGYDAAGSNDFTANNISLTAGTTYDSMTDVPTLTSATAGNYCVLNPLDIPTSGSPATLSEGNLKCVTPSSGYGFTVGTIAVSSGKWYWEYVATAGSPNLSLGFGLTTCARTYAGDTGSYIYYAGDGKTYANAGAGVTYGSTWTTGDVIAVALDLDAGTAVFYKNNVSQGTAFTGLTGTFLPIFSDQSPSVSNTFTVNFGQRPFSYTPPTGFNRLNTFNLPTPTIGATASTLANQYMNIVLYSGNNSTQNITVGFQPDWVWSKCRNVARSHRLSDAVRGSTRDLYSDTTDDEENNGSITAFISTGFSLDNATGSTYNTSGENYVSWAWKANGAGVTNTAGTISATVSANPTAGFSIVAYTGNGTNGATVGHGLGAKPFLIIEKGRTSTYNWSVQGCGELWTPVTSNLFLNGTSALNANGAVAAPTSTVFTPSAVAYANESGITNIAYCFAPVAGYSAIGTYTGNDSADGTFIYTGFRPAFILYKKITGTDGWVIFDVKRNTYNVVDTALQPNTSGAEASSAAGSLDILSNGFKQRNANNIANSSSFTYLYMAFAESPFKYANAR
jgi:hypothetical protein